jgi:DNA gyrase subunit B
MRYQLIDGQGNFGCFTGDTKVRLANGASKTFLELIDDHNKGITHFTYTVDQKNAIQLAPIKIPRLTQKNAALVEVTLDNGEKVRCTLNHKFMVRDGSYVEAQYLVPGQALMPLYTKLYSGADKNLQGYEEVYQPEDQTWQFTLRVADI